jgi:alpha-L-arabinofuranosidase
LSDHLLIVNLADALAAATSTLSLDAQKRAEKDAHKKALKAEAAEAKQAATIASSKVIIKRVERNKVRHSFLADLWHVWYVEGEADASAIAEKIRHDSNGT